MIELRSSFSAKEFSCQVPDVAFAITGTRALVTVTVSKSDSDEQVYCEHLYPASRGEVTLTEMDKLIELKAYEWLTFTLGVTIEEQRVTKGTDGSETVTAMDTRTLSTTVITCRSNILNMTAEDWCAKRFLTLMDGPRTTAMGWQERLCYLGTETPVARAWYDEGAMQQVTLTKITSGDGLVTVNTSPQVLASSGRRLLRYQIQAGERIQDYVVDWDVEPEVAPVLVFWNSFGVQETAYCTGELKQATSFTRSQTRVGRKKKTYLMEEKVTFKADTGILSFPMANWWREVLRSRDIVLLDVIGGQVQTGQGKPIVITQEKMELSNAADSLPRITFEYEYADRNHNIFDVRAEGRIFDDTFDYTFN
ncbi:MAG: hypothetical protein IJ868_00550 [Prevotella sp.]|nr:hypothetical protein [Prevotella sp.]